VTTPIIEPSLLYTGDTWAWERSLPDYPASGGWVLNYVLVNSTGRIPPTSGTIASTASGDTHAISVAAAVTATYAAGAYTWQAFVTKAATSERFTVGQGKVTVKAGLTTVSAASDQRTQAQIALDAATTALATYTASNGHVAEYEIAGRRMKFRSVAELRSLVNYWAMEVQKEVDAENIRRGLGTSRKIFTRFGS
jgi:hypothetical protein